MERTEALKKFAIVAGVASAAWYTKSLLDERQMPTPIWRYRSNPPHTADWDVAVRTASNPLMQILADEVVPHPWDLAREEIKPEYKGTQIGANPKAIKRDGSIIKDALIDTRFGWQDAYVLGIEPSQDSTGWHFAFTAPGDEKITRCRIIIPSGEKIRILMGSEPVIVYTLDTDGNELQSTLEGPLNRRSSQFKRLRLF
ncbi:MAG TPA: hypothetical protein VLE91_03305 [Candidatus Saccharimonadales bacterium]|nr:hypothetical protein [Candidatus Saccharimonadales bacterium]